MDRGGKGVVGKAYCDLYICEGVGTDTCLMDLNYIIP